MLAVALLGEELLLLSSLSVACRSLLQNCSNIWRARGLLLPELLLIILCLLQGQLLQVALVRELKGLRLQLLHWMLERKDDGRPS